MTKTQYLAALKTRIDAMTYDNWKCTDPNDRFLGDSVTAAWQQFYDGEISLGEMGEILLEDGLHPYQVREILSRHTQYPIPKNYFGREE